VNHLAQFAPRILLSGLGALALLWGGAALAQNAANVPTFAPQSPAAGTPAGQVPIVIGVLDTETIVLGSSAGKSLTAQADASLRALQDDSNRKEQALIAQVKQLDAQRQANPAMSQTDYEAKRRDFADQDDKLHADFDKNKQALDDRVDRARQNLLAAATKVVQDVAKARGLTFIVARTSAILFPDQWSITPDVLQRLNRALPNIKL
jgi:Skp family chaperone for outer membrane proteins